MPTTSQLGKQIPLSGAWQLWACAVASTPLQRKHSPATPRLRIIVPFSEDIPADLYAPVVRLLCHLIQSEMTWFDPSTDEAGRLMYWAAHCQDIEPIYYAQDGNGLLDAKGFLVQQLPDWCNTASWPLFPRGQATAKLAAKQEAPETKNGVVGAWCRVHDIYSVLETTIPGVYEATAQADRFTFTGGSTAGGAVVYEGGQFLFSHHATDPAGGRLVNSFDLSRLHLFGQLDDDAKEGARGNRLPSYTAMVDFARKDPTVSDELAREAFGAAFTDGPADEAAALELGHYSGNPLSLDVLHAALKAMGIHVRRNLITGAAEVSGMPPQYSQENALNTLPVVLVDKLRAVGVKGVNRTIVMDYLANIVDENRYNPVLEILGGTVWDGVSRFPELLRILGIEQEALGPVLVKNGSSNAWPWQTIVFPSRRQRRVF